MPEAIRRFINPDAAYRANTFRRIFMKVKPRMKEEVLGLCWEWQGSINKAGYGISSISVVDEGRKIMGVHRIMKALDDDLDAIPAMECHHLCTNPICCNPAHLIWMPQGNHRVWEAVQSKLNAGQSVSLKYVARSVSMAEGSVLSLLKSMGANEKLIRD
jgi:hypothetical protein